MEGTTKKSAPSEERRERDADDILRTYGSRIVRDIRAVEIIETVNAHQTGQPIRKVAQYWSPDGRFLAERDLLAHPDERTGPGQNQEGVCLSGEPSYGTAWA